MRVAEEWKLVGVKRSVLAILNFAKENPLLLYHFIIFIKYLSLPSFIAIIVGLIANHLFLNIILMINMSVIRYETIVGALDRFGDCLYKTCSFKKFLGVSRTYKNIYDDIENNLFLRQFAMFGIKHVKFDDVVKIHVVMTEEAIVDKATAYEIPLFESHVFVGELPNRVKGFSRFMVLHEVGHCLMKVAIFNYSIIAGVKTYIFFLFWILFFTVWNTNSLLLVVLLIIFLFLLKEEMAEQHKLLALREEALADAFAVSFLSKDDLKKLATNKSLEDNLNDVKRLGYIYNKIRLTCLKQNILSAIEGKEEQVLENMKAIVPEKLYIFLYPFLLSGLIGIYSIDPSYKMVGGLFLLAVVMLIIYLFTFIVSDSLKSIINSRIEERQAKMTKQDLIAEILETHFADECDIAGPTNVEKIIKGITKATQAQYGRDMNIGDATSVLIQCIGFINDIISLAILLKGKQNTPPSVPQLKESAESLESFGTFPSELKVRVGDDVYTYVLEKIQKGDIES